MITNISDGKDTKFLSYTNTLSVEIKFHWQIIKVPEGMRGQGHGTGPVPWPVKQDLAFRRSRTATLY